jgi:hypothetical protein
MRLHVQEIMKSLWQPQDLERMLRCKDLPAQAWFSFSSWLKQGRKDLDALLSHLVGGCQDNIE